MGGVSVAGRASQFVYIWSGPRLNLARPAGGTAPAPWLILAQPGRPPAAGMDDPELPEPPPSPSGLIADVQRQLSKIETSKDIATAFPGVVLDASAELGCTTLGGAQMAMKSVWASQLIAVSPVLVSNLENSSLCACLYELAGAVSEMLVCCGGDWFNTPAFLFLQIDDALYRRYVQRRTLFAELCECVTAGQRGDQYAVVRAPIITKTLLAGSGRELVDTLQHWCPRVRGFVEKDVMGDVGRFRCPTEAHQHLVRVRWWCSRLERLVAVCAKKTVPWDRAAVEMAHAFGYDGIGVRERLATVVPVWCPETRGLVCRRDGQ